MDKNMIDKCIKKLLDKDWQKRLVAVRDLRGGGQRAVEPLIRALSDEHFMVVADAAWSLGIIGDKRAINPLIKRYLTADLHEREKIEEALRKLGGEPAVQKAKTLKKLGRR